MFVAVVALLAAATPSMAQTTLGPKRPDVMYPVKADILPALRDVPIPTPEPFAAREVPNRPSVRPAVPGEPENLQTAPGVPNTPDPLGGWPGLNSDDNQAIVGGRLEPPDTQGDIGADYYIQWINLLFAVYDKSGNKVYPPGAPRAVPGNTLWAGFGGPCQNDNDGDPITLWDPLAQRWLMGQFAVSTNYGSGPYYQCIAVSATSDPTGSWYRYAYPWPGNRFPDYPKLGVWHDAYYITTNDFNAGLTSFVGVTAGAFDRAAMLAGSPTAAFISFQLDPNVDYSMLPADLDGLNPPPPGAPGVFAEFQDSTWFSPPLPADQIWVYEFHADWANPANSTFGVGASHTPNYQINITNVSGQCSSRNCVPQPGAEGVDAIDFRIMHRLAYRNNTVGGEMMVTSMTVAGGGKTGIWWGEFHKSGGAWSLHQDGVYSPADTTWRFMPSIAQDTNGNIMLGYSASSSTVYPSVWYVGRLATDPLGTMGDEKVLATGSASKTSGYYRWGDYSMMSIDPVDDCTFWYTQEYVTTGGNFQFQTYIGSMKFPSCSSGPTGTVTGTVINASTSAPLAGAQVQVGSYTTSTNGSGVYTITVPVGTYDVTASKFGFGPETVTGVEVTDGGTTTQDFALTPVGSYFVDGFVTAAGHGWPLWAKIDIRTGTTLVQTLYTSPWNGYYEVELPNGLTYEFTVHSMYQGYVDEVRPVTVASADQVQNFTLVGASGNPAYICYLQGGINEQFEGDFPPAGWTVKNNASNPGNIWKRNDQWGRANLTLGSGTCADADSDRAGSGSGPFDTELWSPPIQMPATPRNLRFKSAYRSFTGQTGTLDVSTNGGNTWTNLFTITTTAVSEPTIDMAAYAGQTIILRWKFVSPNYAWYWQIDDVRTETPPIPPPPPVSQWVENMDGATPPALPTGWAMVRTAGTNTATAWKTNVGTVHPSGNSAYSMPNLVYFNSFSVSTGNAARLYKTTGENISGQTGFVRFWMFHDSSYSGSNDTVQVQYSLDGTTWTNIGAPVSRYSSSAGWAQHMVELTGVSGPSVQIGLLATSAYGNDIHVDDVEFLLGTPGTPAVPDTPTLVCETVPGSMVAGFVTDENTTLGIVGADVVRDLGGATVSMDATGNLPAGFYYMFSPQVGTTAPEGPSKRTFTASKTGYGSVSHEVVLVPATVNRIDFALPSASLSYANWPFVIDGRLTPDGLPLWDKTDMFSVVNSGGLPGEVKFQAVQLGSGYVPPMPLQPAGPLTMAPEIIAKNPPSLRGIERNVPSREPAAPWAAGDVLASWPTGLALPWGCGVTGDTVWASNPSAGGGDDYDYEFTDAGAPTGRKVQAVFGGSWAADMTRADNAGMLWQVNVGGDNCIYELDPATGATGNKICPPFGTSMRGLAYDPDTDTFFAGSWNDNTVYRFDRSGAILQSKVVGLAIAGLAYNPSTGHLFVMVNDSPNLVWVLDVNNDYAALGSFSIAGFGDYSGAGIEFGCTGLWAMNQSDGKAYLVDAGEMYPCDPNLPWFVMNPTEGVVPASGQLDIDAEFFPEGVNPAHFGLFRALVKSSNNTPEPLPDIPVYFTKAFWDVPRGHWADPFIHALAGVRISKGCGGGNFCPDNAINRAEMAVLMVRAMHGPDFAPPPAVGIFVDVPISDTDTTADYIEQLYNDGVVTGCAEGGGGELYYCPNDLVNRAQMSVFVCASLGIPPVEPPTHYFNDLAGYEWAEGYIEAIFSEGITGGCGDHLFCPSENITRAQLAVWLTVGLDLPWYLHPLAP